MFLSLHRLGSGEPRLSAPTSLLRLDQLLVHDGHVPRRAEGLVVAVACLIGGFLGLRVAGGRHISRNYRVLRLAAFEGYPLQWTRTFFGTAPSFGQIGRWDRRLTGTTGTSSTASLRWRARTRRSPAGTATTGISAQFDRKSHECFEFLQHLLDVRSGASFQLSEVRDAVHVAWPSNGYKGRPCFASLIRDKGMYLLRAISWR